MKLFGWLRRGVRRFNRAAEETAVGATVLQSGGQGATQMNAMGTKVVLGEIEKAELETQEDRETP